MISERSLGVDPNLASVESGVTNHPGDQGGIEPNTFLGLYHRFAFFEIDFRVNNAIQASQGPFGPVRSQRSGHAINA